MILIYTGMKLYNYNNFLSNIQLRDIYIICDEYEIVNYTITMDGTINVNGEVDINNRELDKLPLKFNYIRNYFDCSYNHLISLEGCPKHVGGSFNCSDNELTSLKGSPEYVGGSFNCSFNLLESVEGCPKKILGGDLIFTQNDIRDFYGFPLDYEGLVFFDLNPVNVILGQVPMDRKCQFIHLINEYDVIRNRKTIIRDRLAAAYEGIGLELPDDINIYGYEII